MRYCNVERADFPDADFDLRNGVWYHRPRDGEEHVAEADTKVIAREGPVKMPPQPAPPPDWFDAD
jgi:hypothetical protein